MGEEGGGWEVGGECGDEGEWGGCVGGVGGGEGGVELEGGLVEVGEELLGGERVGRGWVGWGEKRGEG